MSTHRLTRIVGWAKRGQVRACPPSAQTAWARRAKRAPFAHPTRDSNRPKYALIIDHHAPGNAADRDRYLGLARGKVDHRDVVAEAIRHIKRLLVARHAEAPRPLADQDIGLDLAARDIDHGDV